MSSLSLKNRARPRSRTRMVPARSSRMLAGLMSRWTRPASSACCLAFEHLVLADGEAAPLAQQDLLGLELRDHAGADEQARQLLGRLRVFAGAVQKHVEALGRDESALADQVQEVVGRRWRRHGFAFRG